MDRNEYHNKRIILSALLTGKVSSIGVLLNAIYETDLDTAYEIYKKIGERRFVLWSIISKQVENFIHMLFGLGIFAEISDNLYKYMMNNDPFVMLQCCAHYGDYGIVNYDRFLHMIKSFIHCHKSYFDAFAYSDCYDILLSLMEEHQEYSDQIFCEASLSQDLMKFITRVCNVDLFKYLVSGLIRANIDITWLISTSNNEYGKNMMMLSTKVHNIRISKIFAYDEYLHDMFCETRLIKLHKARFCKPMEIFDRIINCELPESLAYYYPELYLSVMNLETTNEVRIKIWKVNFIRYTKFEKNATILSLQIRRLLN